MVKLLYVVIDGLPDRVEDKTTLDVSDTPGLDMIAKMGICGLMYTVGKGYAPESDVAVLSILSYNPETSYTGRGPLEAVGVGLDFKEGFEVAFRANFATIDEDTLEVIDRRVGRTLKNEEARELAKTLTGMDLGVKGAYVKVVSTIGHRAVVVLGYKSRLSDNITNTDPAYVRKGRISVAINKREKLKISPCKPLDDTVEAKITARLVNRFTERSIDILKHHPVNIMREQKGMLKANAILLRDPGTCKPKVKPLTLKFGLKFAAIAEMPVEIGIARVLGMKVEVVDVKGLGRRELLKHELKLTTKLLKDNDVVYVHLKGPDEPGHDGDLEGKVREVELIDRLYIQPLLDMVSIDDTMILVTSDHATPWTMRTHTDDPVPIAIAWSGIKPDAVNKFSERECFKGDLGIIEHGWELLPKVVHMLRGRERS